MVARKYEVGQGKTAKGRRPRPAMRPGTAQRGLVIRFGGTQKKPMNEKVHGGGSK